ncbi:hypothetical protein RP20_CCG000598 [Aedes albopictus]|nr:hypothetical protein RP20_CCG000598 [Aedes albopictus]
MTDIADRHRCNLPPQTENGPSGSSLWRNIRRRLRKITLLSPEHPDTETYFRSIAQIANENKRLLRDYPACIIHPLSTFHFYWDVVIFFALLTHLLTLSFVVSYLIYIDVDDFPGIIQFDLVLCVVLGLDNILKLFTGYVVEKRKTVVLDPKKILLHRFKYLRILYDCIGAMPFILLLYKLDTCYYQSEQFFYLVFALFLYFANILRFHQVNRRFETIPKFFKATENQITIMKLIIGTIYVLHWTSCIADILPMLVFYTHDHGEFPEWNSTGYLVGDFLVDMYWRTYRADDEVPYQIGRQRSGMDRLEYWEYRNYLWNNKFTLASRDQRYVLLKLDDAFRNETLPSIYVRSMMDSIQIAMQSSHVDKAGPMATNSWLTAYAVLSGWLWLTYILFTMIRMVTSTDLSATKYDEIVNELKAYAYNRRLSPELKEKMLRHFANRYRMRYFDEESIQNTISANLRRSIRMETCQHLVNNVELFRNLPHALIEDIVDRLKLELFLENDVIIQAGSLGDAMYFIASGTAAVYSASGKELGHLADGAHFGEICLLKTDQKRTANVVALEVCEVYKLSFGDFQMLIEPHSYLLERMQKLANERLAKSQGMKDKISEEDVYDNFLQ